MSGTFIDGNVGTFQAGSAMSQHARVRFSTGKLALAGAADTDSVGTLERASLAADEYVAVRLYSASGTQLMIASGIISANAAVYAAASGKVAASGSVLVGVALNATTANNDLVEVMPSAAAILGSVARTGLTQDDLKPYAIPMDVFRVHDAVQTNLPGTAASDDLALIGGTFGTDAPILKTSDAKATTVTQYARFQYAVPIEYVDGQTATLRLKCAMLTTVSDTTATVDVNCYRAAAPTVDICATAAQSINSLVAANKDFTLTPTNLVAGDVLDIRIAIAITDSATGTAVYGSVDLPGSFLLLDVKG